MVKWVKWGAGLCIMVSSAHAREKASSTPTVPAPPLPAIRAIEIQPASLTLKNGRDEQRVLVLGKTEAGGLVDLTYLTHLTYLTNLTSNPACVEIDDGGYIRPTAAGKCEILISVLDFNGRLPISVEAASLPPVRFVRDVEPLLSKVGCNAGTCHGAAKGKNGFKLSLRGYDPDFDYQALINDLSGRRFNRVNPDESLMLLKPVAEVPHEGRQVLKLGSREYQLLRQWIAEGTKHEDAAQGRATKIDILPSQVEIDLPGRSQQLLVIASYPDGSSRDVTREAIFQSNNKDVADVTGAVINAIRRGESAILVRYEGLYAARQVTVMGDRSGFAWNNPPEFNYVDKHVHAKLKRMKIVPSELCSDAEFVRRVRLDLTGLPPNGDKVRAFLEDKADDKREKLIDELIGSTDFVKCWANKWADLLQCNSENLGQKGVWLFRGWIEKCVAENMPYDKFVRALLLAEGSCYQNPEANYLRVLREPGKITEDVSQTFLGVRFNCNKCHDHPFEKWTQNQYYQFGAHFAQMSIKRGFIGKEVIRNNTGDATPVTGEEILYRSYKGGEVKHPKTDMAVAAKVPFGSARETASDADPREAFVDWLTSKDNPLFAKSMANRVWSYFLGRGIIDPVDDIRASNPASNPELLDALAREFLESNFDVRGLMRTICRSRAYQLSIVPNKWNADDSANFSHAMPRRLSAEQMFDAVMIATGVRPNFNGMPQGMRAVEVPDGKVQGDDFLALFGRPKRMSACECERTSNITLSHALSMINGVTISEAINRPDNKIAKTVETVKDERKITEAIYLACLNRLPTEKEMAAIDFSKGPWLETAQDLTWALINSPSFLFNR